MSEYDILKAKDFTSREELEALQLKRLKAVVENCYNSVPLFKERMDAKGCKPSDIKSLADLKLLPFTQKSDLRDTYPWGLFAKPLKDVVRLHASSGTTGKPIVVGYTQSDLEVFKEVVARSLISCGLTSSDIVQVCYGYGMFTGGLGAHYGAEKLGATVIPSGTGNSERQIMFLQDFGSTAICCTPSYFVHLIEKIQEANIDFKDLNLKAGIFGAEPWTLKMREYIESVAGIKAYDIYGLTEIIGPGVAIECECQNGFHVFEDHFLVEVINPDTGEAVADGEEGELVFTTLTKEAFPMIRYRTHDLTSIIPGTCSCGRTLKRFNRIRSRCDDMLIIRGVNLFPSQIEHAILSVKKNLTNYQIIVETKKNLDYIEVLVEVTPDIFSDQIGELENIRAAISHAIFNTVSLHIPVKLVEPGSIERSVGKAKRVIDKRKQA